MLKETFGIRKEIEDKIMNNFINCQRKNCAHSKWALVPGFLCELKTTHLNSRGICTDYVKQAGKIDAYKEALKRGSEAK